MPHDYCPVEFRNIQPNSYSPNRLEMTEILRWTPPSWWGGDGNTKPLPAKGMRIFASSQFGGDRVKRVSSAYAKAKKCKVCNYNEWPTIAGGVTVGVLITSADKGCAGCLILCGIVHKCALVSKSSSRPFELGLDQRVSCRVERSRLILECYPDASWEVFDPQGKFLMAAVIHHELMSPGRNNPWRLPRLSHEAVSDSGSDEAAQRVSSWLRECNHSHELCRGANSSLPTRVVLIQDPENIKLYETRGEVKPYICLSHCWGKGTIRKTTTATLTEHKRRIPSEKLPQTFQDAISFAYRLGFEYLWIDSLCIIQDSREDWQREGSRMAEIYSGADFTIAATDANIPLQGCFRKHPERPVSKSSYPDRNGSMLDVSVRSSINHYAWKYGEYPLLRRGWTLQECLLSRRVVHFTAEEMFWACRTENKCECSFWWDSTTLPFKNLRSPKYLNTIRHSDPAECIDLWQGIVTEYTSSSLTYETDCFPALQGVSKELCRMKKSAYIAGLWESSIMYDLLWYSDHKDKSSTPTAWRAPSWSWGSIVGRVVWAKWLSEATPLSTCIGKEIVPARGGDGYGELLSAKITLRGRCLLSNVEGTHQPFASPEEAIKYPDHRAWRKCPRRIYLDHPPESVHPDSNSPVTPIGQVKTLSMGVFQAGERYLFAMLILQKMNKAAGTYRRIGYMELETRKGLDISSLPVGNEETLHIV